MVNQTRNTEVSYATAIGTGYYTIYKSGWDFINDLLTLISKSDNGHKQLLDKAGHGLQCPLQRQLEHFKDNLFIGDNATSDVKALELKASGGRII